MINKGMIKKLLIACCFTGLTFVEAATIFIEDFNSITSLPGGRGNLGFFNGNIGFDSIGVADGSRVENGMLVVDTTNGHRGIGIALDPATLGGAGTFQVSFDITNFERGVNGPTVGTGFAQVGIYTGDGFQNGSNNDSLLLNAQTGDLTATGSATASEITVQQFTAAADDITITFEYDGNGTVALFFGAVTNSFPFPEVSFDNIEVRMVPEPSSTLFILASSIFLMSRRHR